MTARRRKDGPVTLPGKQPKYGLRKDGRQMLLAQVVFRRKKTSREWETGVRITAAKSGEVIVDMDGLPVKNPWTWQDSHVVMATIYEGGQG